MIYAYQGFCAEILPVRNQQQGHIECWRYEIFSLRSEEFLFEGYGSSRACALASAEVHIETLAHSATEIPHRAA
jgi:hypothetical protein